MQSAVLANITSLKGQHLPWVSEIKYLGVHVVGSKVFKCNIRDAIMQSDPFIDQQMKFLAKLVALRRKT